MKNQSEITIVEAMESPQYFGPWFRRSAFRKRDSWRQWKCFLRGLFGLPMTVEELEIFHELTGRATAPTQAFNECFIVAGRRAGKSRISATIGAYVAAFRDYGAVLSPGETAVVMLLAADKRQARILKNYIDAFFTEIPTLAALVESRTLETIVLKNRVTIEVHSSGYRNVRGFSLTLVIADEISFWPADAESANPANETLIAVRPGLATIPGSLLLAISSPYSKKGPLFEAFRDHYGKDDSRVLVMRAATVTLNPTINSLTIAAARLRDGVSARSEWDGEFRSDLESLFGVEAIERVVASGRYELPAYSGYTYYAFVDSSGGVSDAMVLSIAHYEAIAVVDKIVEVVPPFSPEQVTREFCGILKKYRVSEVTGDRYGAQWVAESFEKLGIRYRPSERNRSEIYLEFLPAVMSAQVKLLDNRKLVNQLTNLERRTGRNRDIVDHGAGQHDDVANAVAGVCILALGAPGATLGYVEYLKKLSSGEYKDPTQQPAQSTDQFGKEAARAFELKLMGAKPAGASEDSLSACPRCGGPRVRIAGVPIKCNGCGATFASQNDTEPTSISRNEGACCPSPLLQRIPGGWRCAQCGTQTNLNQPTNGVPRSQAETFRGGRAKMNSGAFRQAFARLIFGGKK
ncbi:MAG: hypothetical protein WA766_07645 [Candidatus Acidiferrales bacterium]